MWPKSNNTAAFALDLKSTYAGEHMIFDLLSLANLTQNDILQFLNENFWHHLVYQIFLL
jgi:hypothetical protein